MPIYASIDDVKGPRTYKDTKGYFDVQSIRFSRGHVDAQNRRIGASFVLIRPSDSLTARLLDLLREPMRSTPRDAHFVYLGGELGKPLKELDDNFVFGVTLLSYYKSGDTDTFTFEYLSEFGKPPAALTSSLTSPQDWGRIQAIAHFQRNAGAPIA
jgi:hypothetical protein